MEQLLLLGLFIVSTCIGLVLRIDRGMAHQRMRLPPHAAHVPAPACQRSPLWQLLRRAGMGMLLGLGLVGMACMPLPDGDLTTAALLPFVNRVFATFWDWRAAIIILTTSFAIIEPGVVHGVWALGHMLRMTPILCWKLVLLLVYRLYVVLLRRRVQRARWQCKEDV